MESGCDWSGKSTAYHYTRCGIIIYRFIQYAQRLSGDKHIDDVILPFDKNSKEQAEHYKKIAGSVGIKHENHQLSWGEQWLDTPFATTDSAHVSLSQFTTAWSIKVIFRIIKLN